ncbi:MAG: hypothetical protein LBH06_05080 [Rikenellaceae bacterium]|jgi:hypothetical protein|nr:hypothetical protein [Rikenellaceae bacterium]
MKRKLTCPRCNAEVTIPWGWALGVEIVFRCGKCDAAFRTGYKMGAALSALALTASLAAANICVWLFSSFSLILFALLVVPMWLLLSFLLRRRWLTRKARRKERLTQEAARSPKGGRGPAKR